MDKPAGLYQSSVGSKVLVALTGLFLCSFLVVHLSGNLLLFKQDGGRAFDEYSEFMSTSLGIRFMEFVLAAGFLGHILLGTRVWMYNRRRRPEPYMMSRPSENSALAARVMFVTGSVVFIFLVIHLKTFFVPSRFAGDIKPSMYGLVSTAFANPVYSGFYLVSLALMGYHLRHGFQSAFQTLGVRPHWRTVIDYVGMIFWLLIPAGYAAMPVYFLWAHWAGAH
jgi:succinate dehydrogenase / fumarate reductase, cytochrome b subunit